MQKQGGFLLNLMEFAVIFDRLLIFFSVYNRIDKLIDKKESVWKIWMN